MRYDFIDVFIFSIPEMFVTLLLALSLLRVGFDLKKVILASIIQGFAVYFIRELPIYVLAETILELSVSILIISYIFKIKWNLVFISMVITLTIYALVEQISLHMILLLFHKTLKDILKSKLRTFLAFLPQLFYMLLIYIVFRRYDIAMIRDSGKEE